MPLLEEPSNWVRIFGSSDVTSGSWDNVREKSLNQVLVYIALLIACYVLTELILKQITDWKDLKLKKLAGSLSMYPAFFVMVYTSHIGSFTDARFTATLNYHDRYHSSSDTIDMFANFYIAANIVQAIGQVQTEKPPLLYQLMAHHVLSIACYTSGFYFDRFRWWEAFAGMCEITNLFLVPVFACKEFFPEWQEQTWYLWNSRFLWFFFVIHRLILFPCKYSILDESDVVLANKNYCKDEHIPNGMSLTFVSSIFWIE